MWFQGVRIVRLFKLSEHKGGENEIEDTKRYVIGIISKDPLSEFVSITASSAARNAEMDEGIRFKIRDASKYHVGDTLIVTISKAEDQNVAKIGRA